MDKISKKKMAFVDLTNFKNWPMGGMLEYELSILYHLIDEYEVDIWGVSVDGKINKTADINGRKYPIKIWGNVKTINKIIPNYWRGLSIFNCRKDFPQDYDIIYVHTGSCLVGINHIIDKNKTKLVYHQHGLNHKEDYSLMSLCQRPLLSRAQQLADLVFVVSDTDSVDKFSKEMKNKSKARFRQIGSPVNLSKFNESSIKNKILSRNTKKTNNFLYTGRLSAFKNVKTIVKAFNEYVKNINIDAVLKIAGTGEEFNIIERLISEYGITNNVKLLGAVSHDEIYKLLEEADVFLTASGGEGVSVSVIEAYAAGLPVVCFKVPGLERQVIDGVTGVHSKEKSEKAFFEAMVELDTKRQELAFNCLEEAAKYDSKIIATKIIEEIEDLFNGGK